MTDLEEFKQYSALANQLVDSLTKDQIAECLRVVTIHLADYHRRFGEVPKPDLLELAGATELTEDQTRLVRNGMELLVGYLAWVREGWEADDGPVH